jgi:hypothetical protein
VCGWELHYSLLQPPLRPTIVGCGGLFFLCIWICCIRRSFIILVCIGLSVLFCFVLIRSFYFSVPGAGVSWGWSWGTVGVCVDDSLPASSDLVLSFGKLQLLRRGVTAREVLECTSAYLRQCSALRMYDP